MTKNQPSNRVLRLADVIGLVGLKRSTIYANISEGSFPPPLKLTPKGRASGWLLSDIEAWLQSRKEGLQ